MTELRGELAARWARNQFIHLGSLMPWPVDVDRRLRWWADFLMLAAMREDADD